jgi:FlaA1/EpsC-like NDP-sugar epimerase
MSVFNSSLNVLFRAPRTAKRVISVFADLFFVSAAFWSAMLVRLDTSAIFGNQQSWVLLLSLMPIALVINVRLGLYRAVIRFLSSKAAASIGLAVLMSTLSLILLSYYLHIPLPRTVPIIFAAFLIILIGGSRVFFFKFFYNI